MTAEPCCPRGWLAVWLLVKVSGGDALGMSGWPLHQLNPVAVGIGKPRGLGAVCANRVFQRPGPQSGLCQRADGGGEVVDLHDEVAEAGATVDFSVGRPVDELKRGDVLAREIEYGEAGALADVDATVARTLNSNLPTASWGSYTDPPTLSRTPRAVSSSAMARASGRDRASRSSLVTTRVSPSRHAASASRNPGRSRLV
jgi:hypothetical protein